MTHTTLQYAAATRKSALRAVFGAAAVAATALTLGVAVLAPAATAPAASVLAHVQTKRIVLAPTEVAIVPASIEVVAARTKAARAGSPYVPANFQIRR